jgi:serine-type D-Ala-D-Ala carboxypeptidase
VGDLTASSVQRLLTEGYAARIASGFAAAWGDLGSNSAATVTVGRHSWDANALPVTESASLFDLASLTKVISGGTYFFQAYDRGEFSFEETLGDCLGINGPVSVITLRELLTHTSGLPAIADLKRMHEYAPNEAQRGQVVYSDVGFLLLNEAMRSHSAQTISSWFLQEIHPQLESGNSLHYRPLPQFLENDPSCVATEVSLARGLIQGQVNDTNTFLLGGESLHAGLFGSLTGVVDWVKAFFDGKFCSPRTLHALLQNWNPPGAAPRAIAWDMPAPDGSGSTGRSLTGPAVGHLGFTGTSLWVDLDRGRYAVLLTNRVHPRCADSQSIRNLRRAFHAIVFDT